MKMSQVEKKIYLFRIVGILLILSGIFLNEWTIAKIFSPDGILSIYSRYLIWVFDLTLIFIGHIFIIQNDWYVYRWGGVVILTVISISLLVGYVFRMGYLIQIDYNEGWNVYHTTEIVSGQQLYPDRESLTPVNYPPISFYVIGSATKLLHDPLIAGRMVSLLSLIVVLLTTGVIVYTLSQNYFASFFSAALCLGFFVTYGRGYVAMNDPQMLGHALMLVGLMIYLKNRARLFIVAFLCCLGLFIKINLLPLLIAISVDILFYSRRSFFQWLLACFIVSSSFLVFTLMTLGPEFLYQVVAPRGYDIKEIFVWINRIGVPLFVSLLLTIPGLYQMTSDDSNKTVLVYLLLSFVLGIYTLGGVGTDINMLFDLFISISIMSSMSFMFVRNKILIFDTKASLFSILAPVIFGFHILGQFPVLFPKSYTFYQYSEREQAFLADATYLSSRTGPMICSKILLCYYAEQPFVLDPFLVTEGIISGRFNEDKILTQLESGYYQVVQLDYPIQEKYFNKQFYASALRSDTIFTENFMRTLAKHYILTRETSMGVFYEPRE